MKTMTKIAALALLAVTASHSAMAQSFNHTLARDSESQLVVDTNDIQLNRNAIRFIDAALLLDKVQGSGSVSYDKVEMKYGVDCGERTITRIKRVFFLTGRGQIAQLADKNPGENFKSPASGIETELVRLACAKPAHTLRMI